MNSYLLALKKYAVFTGRARRQEFWMFILFNAIFAIVAMILDNVLGTNFHFNTDYGYQSLPYGGIYVLYSLAVFIPGLAVSVRRLHDVGKSGAFLLIALIPLIGSIWLLVLFFTDGEPGQNRYGDSPKNIQPNTSGMYNSTAKSTFSSQQPSAGGYQGDYSGGHNNPNSIPSVNPNQSNSGEYQSGDLYR